MSGGMTALVADYIALRRGLGYRSPSQERALRALARYLDQAGHDGPVPLCCRTLRISVVASL